MVHAYKVVEISYNSSSTMDTLYPWQVSTLHDEIITLWWWNEIIISSYYTSESASSMASFYIL